MRVALLVSEIFTTESVVCQHSDGKVHTSTPDCYSCKGETFPVKCLANSWLPPGGYILTQIPIIDGLRRSTDYDDDLGYGRTYDEFDDEYDISTVGPVPTDQTEWLRILLLF